VILNVLRTNFFAFFMKWLAQRCTKGSSVERCPSSVNDFPAFFEISFQWIFEHGCYSR